jgi:DNA ligase-1
VERIGIEDLSGRRSSRGVLMKPMLAVEFDPAKLRFPLIGSPKLDGIRGLVEGNTLLSRSRKPIPNKWVQAFLGRVGYDGLDGELIVGLPTDKHCYSESTSHLMAHDKKDFDFTYYVFDLHNNTLPYNERRRGLETLVGILDNPRIVLLEERLLNNEEELLAYEHEKLAEGYEGLILRDPAGLYKFGRSTVKEGLLLKVKRFKDSEAIILGFEEETKNENVKVTNELGRGQRSSHKENLVPKDTLGALLVRDIHSGVEFNIGTGLTDEVSQEIWDNRQTYLGKIVKYKYFEVGVVDKPRHPVYLGIREEIDLSD